VCTWALCPRKMDLGCAGRPSVAIL
jgi:hypothetical protein